MLELHGLMAKLVVVYLTLYQFTVVNSANQIRYLIFMVHFSYLFSACILLFCDKKNEGLLIVSWTGEEDLSVPQE